MTFLRRIISNILKFFTRRLMFILRLVVGIFMILIGVWFVLAPISQQFFEKQDALQDTPYLWLIVPVGIIQIVIGTGILRPLFHKNDR